MNKTHPGKYPDAEDFVDNSSQGIAPAFGEGSVAKIVPTIFEPSAASQVGPACAWRTACPLSQPERPQGPRSSTRLRPLWRGRRISERPSRHTCLPARSPAEAPAWREHPERRPKPQKAQEPRKWIRRGRAWSFQSGERQCETFVWSPDLTEPEIAPLATLRQTSGIVSVSNDVLDLPAVNADVVQHPVVQGFQRRYRRPDVAFPAKPPPPSDNRGCDRAAPPPQDRRARWRSSDVEFRCARGSRGGGGVEVGEVSL